MQSNSSLEWPLLLASIPGIAISSVMIFFPNLGPSVGVSDASFAPDALIQNARDPLEGRSLGFYEPSAPTENERSPLPVRLRIPSINVDAAVEYVGVNADGAMDVPKNRDEVAWFEPGVRPGEDGSAVMAGHYGRKNGMGSVFDNLHVLRVGDTVYVENGTGASLSFVVRGSRRYDPNADASGVFSSGDGTSHLNLITCEGVWDDAIGGFPKRLVVFTDLQ